MAQKKAGGSSKNGRDSISKRLGIKTFHNNFVKKSSLIIKQNGTKYLVGNNAYYSKNHSIHSNINGIVFFKRKKKKTYIIVKNVY
ncbi:50S ribosomal protein L27 [Candidatus Carsonella ruddii]|uniref:Large ribosomal subunit protein bL27 n=1 Tax=Candidatus Carsonella ruddii PC isolate NHV TaxID=1202540 RepID=J3Z2G2_CARRU|nr:50S ribosomal protein L27 [Candidatus Carsonella ruddii]AFP84359.1 ribosomal protein L27 [Candidatus Carsonella ruddii PC isolate NHV]